MQPIFSIDCRSVGPGGTTVSFYLTSDGLKAIWSNENCPYDLGCKIDDETYEASDGHNVSFISWEELASLRNALPKKEEPLRPQPKRQLNKRKGQ